jgi:hypothetical protein
MLSLSLTNEDNLEETYNLQMCVEEARQNMERYNMNDVFTIIQVDGNKNAQGDFSSLWDMYVLISADKVGKSNEFCAAQVNAIAHPYIRENLTSTCDYFQNNAEPDLFQKCLETYNSYNYPQRGGPLFFKIMMTQLQSNSVAVVQLLGDRITNLNLKDFNGEDLTKT